MSKHGKLSCALLATITIVAGLIATLPMALPHWMYQAIYGWRYPKKWTCGDASLSDSGPRSASNRYQIDLGPLHQTPQIQTFKLCELPSDIPLWFGVVLPNQKKTDVIDNVSALFLDKTHLSVAIDRTGGGRVAGFSAPLRRGWTWAEPGPRLNTIFIYGDLRVIAEEDQTYTLRLKFSGTPSTALIGGELVLLGGGWK